MNKKQIVIMAGIGLICFGVSFTVGLFTRTSEPPATTDGTPDEALIVEPLGGNTDPVAATTSDPTVPSTSFEAKQVDLGKSLTKKQLNSLVFEMRSKLTEFTTKEKMLIEKEGRIQMSIDELQNNVNKMENLRVKLAAAVSSIKQQQKVLDERLIMIEEVEMKNIIETASIYDKMKPQQASNIMINLSKSNQLDFVVKITYYMTKRTSASMLAELSKNEPLLAASISDRLRWIKEAKP